MKRTILYFLFLIYTVYLSNAQQWQWAVKIGTNAMDAGLSLANDAFGNIYLASQSNTHYVSKHNVNGVALWNRSTNGQLKAIATDKVGNLYVIGRSGSFFQGGNNSDISLTTVSTGDAFLVKYNTQGDIQWAQIIHEPSADTYVFNVKCDNQGNAIVCGHSVKNNNGYFLNYFVLKYNASGNLLWNKNSNWKGNIVPKGLAADEDGNCYVAGSFNDSAFFNNIILVAANPTSAPIFIVKYDYNGNVMWAKKDGTGSNNDCVALDYRQGKLVATGGFMPPSTFGNQLLSGPNNTGEHFFISQYDSSGNFRWAKSALYAKGHSVIMDKDQNSIVVGSFKSPSATFGTGQSTLSLNTSKINNEIFVAKYDSAGIFAWAVAPGGNYGGGNGANAITSSNNNYIVTGEFTETTTFGSSTLNAPVNSCGGFDVFLASIKDSTTAIITNIQSQTAYNEYSLWPNPTSEYLFFRSNMQNGPITVKILSVLGQPLLQKTLSTNVEIEIIPMFNYTSGVYLIEIINSEEKRTYRIIKQ
jgi:hypothetical protein